MKIGYLTVLVAFFLGSCNVLQPSRSKSEIPEESRIEYDFSLIEAQKQMMLGNYAKAKTLYLRCLEFKPVNAAVNYQLANIYITAGKSNSALSYARKAFEIDQTNEWYSLQMAQIFRIQNKLDSTIYCYQLLKKFHPKYEYKITLAALYLKAERLNSALKLVNTIESEYGLNKQLITFKYKIYILKNDNKRSIKILQDAIQKFPDETQYYGLLGEHFSTIGDYESALANFTQIIRNDPENEKGYVSVIGLFLKYHKYSLAIDSTESFLKRNEISIDSKTDILSELLSEKLDTLYSKRVFEMIDKFSFKYPDNYKVSVLKADYYIIQKQIKNAEAQLKDILLTDKKEKIVWEKLALVLRLKKDFKEMNKVTGEGIILFPGDALLYFYHGISLVRIGSYQDASHFLETGLKYGGDDYKLIIQIYSLLGECYHLLQEYEKSDEYFELAIKMDPGNLEVLNTYSSLLVRQGNRLNKALQYSKRCINLQPHNVTFLDTYGWILFKSGKVRKAEEIVRKALEFGGLTNKNILEHYIEILVMLNKKSEATQYSEILMKLESDSSTMNKSDK